MMLCVHTNNIIKLGSDDYFHFSAHTCTYTYVTDMYIQVSHAHIHEDVGTAMLQLP